ncbi:MAG: type IV pilus assembly protein PilM [Candidatus Paceibacterota bacterium]|jgi:type IV pilus assembly protein PilM
MKSSFSAFFPLPNSLVRPAVGLDVSDESIKLIELSYAGGQARLKQFAELPIPPGAIVAGQIKQPADLTMVLASIRKRYNIFQANVSLPEELTYVTKVRVALAPKVDIREQIGLHLDEYVPLPPQETEFDFELIAEQGDSIDCAVVALPRETVTSYLGAFKESGIEPLAFEIEAQAVARSLIKSDDTDTIMTVDFGKARTGLAIVSEGRVLFSATLPFGGRYNTNIVMQMEKLDEAKAEALKRNSGLSRASGHEELYSMLLSHISVLRDEMNKYLLFWGSHKKEGEADPKPVNRIILAGGESNLLGLPEYLSATLGLKVVMGNPWINAFSLDEYIPPIEQPASLRYATAIGLALRANVIFS